MSEYVKQYGRVLIYILPLTLAVLAFAIWPASAPGGTYVNPFWTQNSTSPECGSCSGCGCPKPSEWSPEGVSYRTGELKLDHFLFSTPGVLGSHAFVLRWRSMNGGVSQLGRGVLPSWETTANKIILISGNPNGPSGHAVQIRRPIGVIDEFLWDGTAYGPNSCFSSEVSDTLTTNGSGNYVLTDKHGNSLTFDSLGMPATATDRNGNTVTYTYNSSYRLTGITDDRGLSYTIAHNAGGFISSMTDPAGRAWTLTYDASDNLKTIKTPTTPDQTSGITTTLNYDVSDRLTSITDGRGNSVWSFAYVGSTSQVSSVTINSNSVSYSYASGVTSRTDRNGNVNRVYFTGQNITSTDMLVGGVAKYTTLYRYTGTRLSNFVTPRGSRTDYVYDSAGNIIERRHRVSDTASIVSTDIAHNWTFSSSTNFPLTYTDPEGNVWTYTEDAAGNRTAVTHPNVTSPASQSAGESWTYNSLGQVLTHIDEEGLLTTNVYFSTGSSVDLMKDRKVGPTLDPLVESFTYDSAGNLATRTDRNGSVFESTSDNLRRLSETEAPSPLSYRVQYKYDANGNRTQRDVENFDKDGNVVTGNAWFTTTWAYTAEDQVSSITEEIDATTTRTTSFDYDANGNRIRVTKPEGNKEKWVIDERNLVAEHIRGEGDAAASTTESAYDDNGNLVTRTDGRGNDWDTDDGVFDRATKSTDPAGHYAERDYDKRGAVTETRRKDSSDALLQRSTRYTDERGRLWKTSDLRKDPGTTYSDAVTTITRRKDGLVSTVTDTTSATTTNAYDDYSRLDGVTDAEGNLRENEYDDNGNLTAWSIEETDGTSTVTHNYEATFDVLNRRLTQVEIDRVTPTNDLTITNGYDSRSNIVWRVDAKGNPMRIHLDGVGQMLKRERALTLGATINDFTAAQVTEWGRDLNGRLNSHKDDGAHETTWTYDALDRVDEMEYPDTNTIAYEYDKNDNVLEIIDAAGNVIEDTFDVRNLNTSRSVTLATGFGGTTSETRTFDALGRLLTAADNDYKVTLTYGVRGMASTPYEETQEYVGGTAYPVTVTKTHDAAGRKATEAYPSGLNLTYAYNDIGALETISDGTNTIVTYAYQGARLQTATFQSGATQTNSYTGYRGEISSIHHKTSASATIERMDYGYDANHDRLYERYGASGAAGDGFAYDRLRRLTTAWMGSVTPSAPTSAAYVEKIDFNMDDDGNRTSVVKTPYGLSPTTDTYTTNSLNQYTAAVGVTQVHDANGNLTDNGTYLFKYDYRNRLIQVKLKSTSTVVADYKFDALGRRVEKALSASSERYVLSGLETIEVRGTTGGWRQRYVFRNVIDGIVLLEQADVLDFDADADTAELTRSFYHTSALGSVMQVTDMSEVEVQSIRYNPYGSVSYSVGGVPQSGDVLGQLWGFTGRQSDAETGGWHYRARHYSGAEGRFIQRDPLGLDPGPQLYEYVWSSPVVYVDPLGLDGGATAIAQGARIGGQVGSIFGPGGAVVGAAGVATLMILAALWGRSQMDDPPNEDSGTCGAGQYAMLVGKKVAACAKKMKCTNEMSCKELLLRMAARKLCIKRRQAVMDRCFGGGDPRHKDPKGPMAQHQTGLNTCRTIWLSKCMPTATKAVVADMARNLNRKLFDRKGRPIPFRGPGPMGHGGKAMP